MSAEVRRLNLDDARLAYDVRGEDGAPPLIFVHGYSLRATGEMYEGFLDRLSRAFLIHSIDLRGHGESQDTGGWGLAQAADDIAAAVGALGLVRPDYVGHSIGGLIGMTAEVRHPGTFRSLSLLATAPATGGHDQADDGAALFIEQGRDLDAMRGAFAPMFTSPNRGLTDKVAGAACLVKRAIHESFFPEYALFDITRRLSEITPPALFVNGLRDVVIDPDRQMRTAAGILRSKQVIHSGLGHLLPIEAPEVCAREVEAFIRYDVSLLAAA